MAGVHSMLMGRGGGGTLRMVSSASGLNVQYDKNILSGVELIQNMGARFKIDGPRGRGTVFRCTFETDSYFIPWHPEHIAIGIRGNIYKPDGTMALTGKGVIIGNVTGYGAHSGVCKPTTKANTVAIESFWEGGNCVYGNSEVSTNMINSTASTKYEYQLTIIADDIDKTIRIGIGENTIKYDDPFYDNSPSDDYWFIGTVPSGRDWSFNVYNMVAYHYNDIADLPEDMR